ncbi:hypothetical protein [Aminobacter sp. Piv2-1]|uniref:hypothetical protein n=1 Tax=Aminobacter sp. Piv2-1 TaxID=3031122 RepID=UPI00309547EE
MSPVQKKRTWLWVLAGLFVCGLFAFMAFGMVAIAGQPIWNPLVKMQADQMAKAVPEKLGPVQAELIGTIPGPIGALLEALLLIRVESCGGGVFRISSVVAQQIEREGLSFFAGVEQGRAGESGPGNGVRYQPWQQTPIPESWNVEGVYARGFQCMNPTQDMYDLLRGATSVPGSYFSSAGSAEILVVPKSQMVVVTFSD